jgi:putative oxidoreductase
MDFGILMLRAMVGSVLVAHGAQKLFGAFGGHGLEGTGQFLESMGFRPGRRYAALAGLSEFGGGLLLVLGLLTPLAAAAAVGMMVTAIVTVHQDRGFFNSNGGYEFPMLIAVAATAVAFTGPGSISIDAAVGRTFSGAWGVLAVLVGVLSAAGVLATRKPAAEVAEEAGAEEEQEERRAA